MGCWRRGIHMRYVTVVARSDSVVSDSMVRMRQYGSGNARFIPTIATDATVVMNCAFDRHAIGYNSKT